MTEIPLASAERILRNAGKCRVSADAADQLCHHMQDYGHELARKALVLAHHANRKTITAPDVVLAAKDH